MPKNKNKKYKNLDRQAISAHRGKKQRLVKIGELAREYQILPSTINFYTREGLLPEDARSIGGYRLYDRERSLALLKKIDYLQKQKRFTIQEIKKIISKI